MYGAVLVVAITAGAMMNLNLNKVSNKGDLALANAEALADSEAMPDPDAIVPSGSGYECYKTISSTGVGPLVSKDYCSPKDNGYKCDPRDMRQYSSKGICHI